MSEPIHDPPVHAWFGLTYANYLVMPRSLLQSMPHEWQAQLVALLWQWESMLHHAGHPLPDYAVNTRGDGGRFALDYYANYRHKRHSLEPVNGVEKP